MADVLSALGILIADACLAAFLISVTIVLAMISTRQPARRRTLARVGLIGTLLAVPGVAARPFAPVELLPPIRTTLAPARSWIASALGISPRLDPATRLELPGFPGEEVRAVLVIGYLAGVGVALARLGLGWWGLGWIGRHAIGPGGEARSLHNGLPFPPGRRRPGLRISSRAKGAALVGVVRPTVVIPAQLEAPESAATLRLALLHELAHAEARDPIFGLASELAAAAWFFLPTVWWIRRQMRLDQEFLADHGAALGVGTTRLYASALLDIARVAGRSAKTPVDVPVGSGAGSPLYQRFLMLLRCPFPIEMRPPGWWRFSATASVGGVVLLGTGLTIRGATVDECSAPPARSSTIFLRKVLLADNYGSDESAVLPIHVRDRFTLTFDVHAARSELAEIRILGHPIGPPPPSETVCLLDGPSWHRVRVDCLGETLGLAVDTNGPLRLHDPARREWITLRGVPGRVTAFRDFRMTW